MSHALDCIQSPVRGGCSEQLTCMVGAYGAQVFVPLADIAPDLEVMERRTWKIR